MFEVTKNGNTKTNDMKTQVTHSQFGKGEVTSFDGKFVTVLFDGEEKKLYAKIANLENADGSEFVPKQEVKIWVNPSNQNDVRLYFGDRFSTINQSSKKAFIEVNGVDVVDIMMNKAEICIALELSCLILMDGKKHIDTYYYN